MKRLALALLTLVVAGLAVPAAGQAGVASVRQILSCSPNQEGCGDEGGETPQVIASIQYEDPSASEAGGAAETNAVTISRVGETEILSVKDEAATVVAGERCELVSEHEAWCSRGEDAPRWNYGYIGLGGGDDAATNDTGLFMTMRGGSGRDVLTRGTQSYGEDGPDVLTGTDHNDSLDGGNGDDLLDGRAGRDLLHGGRFGVDTITYASRAAGEPVTVRLDNTANDGGAADKGAGTTPGDRDVNVERVIGGAGGDTIVGTSGPNRLTGGAGDDVLDGGLGRDLLLGGDGTDTLSYADRAAGAPVAVRLDGAGNDGADPDRDGTSTASEEGDRDQSIENATGGKAPDRLVGSSAVNALLGGAGIDRLDGGPGGDLLDGGTGLDTLDYSSRSGGLAVTLDGVRNDGSDPNADGSSAAGEENDRDVSIETVWGGSGPDRLTALLAGANILSGNGGADQLFARDGGSAVDNVYCGAGTDSFQVDGVDRTYACETAVP